MVNEPLNRKPLREDFPPQELYVKNFVEEASPLNDIRFYMNTPVQKDESRPHMKTATPSGSFRVGDRVVVNENYGGNMEGREGEVTGIYAPDEFPGLVSVHVKFFRDGWKLSLSERELTKIELTPSSVNFDNPNCTTCGTHLGIENHTTQQHSEALEVSISLVMD